MLAAPSCEADITSGRGERQPLFSRKDVARRVDFDTLFRKGPPQGNKPNRGESKMIDHAPATEPHTARAQCLCGAVKIELSAPPVLQVYCHCTTCRRWSGQPVTACVLFAEDAVRIVEGGADLLRYQRGSAPEDCKISCQRCGGAVGTFIARVRQYDIFAGIIRDFTFAPSAHVNYAERVLDIPDGLPKFRDMPERAGGSGQMIEAG